MEPKSYKLAVSPDPSKGEQGLWWFWQIMEETKQTSRVAAYGYAGTEDEAEALGNLALARFQSPYAHHVLAPLHPLFGKKVSHRQDSSLNGLVCLFLPKGARFWTDSADINSAGPSRDYLMVQHPSQPGYYRFIAAEQAVEVDGEAAAAKGWTLPGGGEKCADDIFPPKEEKPPTRDEIRALIKAELDKERGAANPPFEGATYRG